MFRSKRVLCILLILIMVISSSFLSIFTNAEEAYPVGNSFLGSVYSPFGASQNAPYYKNSGGSYSTTPFPGSTMAGAMLYTELYPGYVYTFKQRYRLSAIAPINNQQFTDDMFADLIPTIVIGQEQDYINTLSDAATTTFFDQMASQFQSTFRDKIKYSVYITGGRTIDSKTRQFDVECVFEIIDPYIMSNKAFGFGFSAPFETAPQTSFSKLWEGGIIATNLTIVATRAVNEQTFYDQNLSVLNEIEQSITTTGAATVSTLQSEGSQTRQSIDDLKEQMHEDAEQAHLDAQQAHEDAQNAPQHEYDFGVGLTPDPDDLEIPNPDLDEPKSFFNDLLSAVSTTETLDSITLPSVTIPFLGINLFDNGSGGALTIDFSEWLQNEKIQLLVGWTNGIFCIGAIVAILWKIVKLIETALGLRSAESPDSTGSSDTDSNSDSYSYTYHSDGGWYS